VFAGTVHVHGSACVPNAGLPSRPLWRPALHDSMFALSVKMPLLMVKTGLTWSYMVRAKVTVSALLPEASVASYE